jgi:hypothetical protein
LLQVEAVASIEFQRGSQQRVTRLRKDATHYSTAMYIPFWLLFTFVMWTLLAARMCREEAYAAGVERRTPDYRSCWGAASLVMGVCIAAFAAMVLLTPMAFSMMGGLFDQVLQKIG